MNEHEPTERTNLQPYKARVRGPTRDETRKEREEKANRDGDSASPRVDTVMINQCDWTGAW